MHFRPVLRRTVPLLLVCLGAARCTGSGPADDIGRERVQLAPVGPVLSGATLTIIATVEDPSGTPLPDRAVTFIATAGATVTPTTGRTDSDGRLQVQWQTLDRDTTQTLMARTDRTSDSLSLITTPNVSSLEVAPSDTTVDLGATITLRALGVTPTGRRVSLGAAATLGLVSEVPDSPVLPVTALPSAIGPGVAYLRAQFGPLQSDVATVRVRRSQPIVRAPPADRDVTPGGTLTLDGLGLDQLDRDAITVDGRAAPVVDATATTLTVRLPQTPGCTGRARWSIAIRGAFLPSPVAVVVRRAGDVQLGVGETVSLRGVADSICLQFPPTAAEYAVVMTDTRSITMSSRDAALLRSQRLDLSVSDRTVSTRAASRGELAVRSPVAESSDAVIWSRGALSATNIPPADWTAYRTVPYRVGDRFSVRADGVFLGGSIFRVSPHLAVGILDRDADLNLPTRLRDLDVAMQFVEAHGVPVLRDVFGPEWPATSEGSGQTMVIITRIAPIGLAAVGQRELINGQWQQGVVVLLKGDMPGDQVIVSSRVLTHELGHAAQDRHTLIRCRDLGECRTSWFDELWATEGGAELVAEEAQRREVGLSRRGNHPLQTLQLINYYGFRGFFGQPNPHWDWGWGYASSTPILNDLVERVVERGATANQALSAVVLGAFEGWTGLRGAPGVRPGLQERLRPWLGTEWRPEDAVRRALRSLALDDRITSPEYTVPFFQNASTFFSPAVVSESGRGESWTVRVGGDTWAHYTLRDDGIGGSWLLTSTASGLDWSVTRIR
jgi:Bacterial Ig-like domain (group 1)